LNSLVPAGCNGRLLLGDSESALRHVASRDPNDRNAEAIARLERHNAGRHRRSERPTDGYALRNASAPQSAQGREVLGGAQVSDAL
jgi:hypothetical protein